VSNLEGTRLVDIALSMVQLIVRNLYERTADVRWWATDEAFYKCLEDPSEENINHAMKRLGVINRFYTVYMNLVIADTNGKVIAISKPDEFYNAIGADVSRDKWFAEAMHTRSGDDYIVDDIHNDPVHNNKGVAVYSTAVRKGGELSGQILGVMGVFFDWGEQSRIIVQEEPNFSDEEWKRSRVMLLDSKHRIIASSDGNGYLTVLDLHTDGKKQGSYIDGKGNIVAFAQTLGYEQYDGLGWYGVVVQKPISPEEIERAISA